MHFASDVSPFAMARDKRVCAALEEAGVEPVRHPGLFVADVGKPRTKAGKPYAVFSPFWRAWTQLDRREVHGAPRKLALPAGVKVGELPSADALGLPDDVPDPFPPGEAAARARMHAWLKDGIRDYADRHDRLEGGTSELSPYLHLGCLSPRELEQRARDAGAGKGPAEFVRQLCWRDFYAHVLLTNPANARHAHQPAMDELEWEDDEEAFEAWCEGRTGFPVVDAAMRQLRERGWMHNRARLIVGSFLTKDLHIDWRRGEAHFMSLLTDGDEASNNGNWQWIASVGVDPAPYFRRMYNPATQQERHDPDGAYVRRWVPELRDVPLERLAAAVDDERGRAGGGGLRDRPRLPGADRRPQARARARDGALPGGARRRSLSSPPRDEALPPGQPARGRPAAAAHGRAHAARRARGELLVPPAPGRLRVDRRPRARAAGGRPRVRGGLRLGGARAHGRVGGRRRRQPGGLRARAAEVHERERRASSAR